MVKTDNRHGNNSKSNRDLHIELDLWLKFVENGKQPFLIGKAVSEPSPGASGNTYFMWYMGDVKRPINVIHQNGISEYQVSSGNITQAKRRLKNWDSRVKWIK